MSVLDFFPVSERSNLGRLTNSSIKAVVFGCDNMKTLTNKNLQVENNFPWSLSQEKISSILQPYINKDFIAIAEVGTHIGTTATRFAKCILDNKDSYVMCIDTWLADVADYVLRKDGMKYNLNEGNEHVLFDRFIQNIQNNGVETSVIPFRLPSLQAGQILYFYGIQFDIIYIDASHEYLNVKQDLELYYELLAENGVLFGDDYNIDGVKRAVDEFVSTKGLTLVLEEGRFFDNVQQIFWKIERKN
jgi:predicted O-methyltransferase YrrM